MKTNDSNEPDIFTTGTSISDSSAWFLSLGRQVREFLKERRNPTPRAEITAELDPSALDKLVDPPSQILSMFSTMKAVIHDAFHPRHIEMTATPVEVQDLWSKKENHIPGLLSLLAHVGVVTALIVLSVMNLKPKIGVETASLLMEPITVSLPPSQAKSHGGGGGGTKAPTPVSKGQLPKAADKQFVPPTPVVVNMAPELAVEPTIIAPTLTNLPRLSNLIPIGDPKGLSGPPSAGPGTGAGMGTGDGHGFGAGDGPGLGPGRGGGTGGGAYQVGGAGGVAPPTCPVQVEPNYSDDARKAHIQGTVVLDAIIQKDGSVEARDVLQKLGYGLDEEARKVLTKWRCTPTKVNGQPVAVQLKIQINFRLY